MAINTVKILRITPEAIIDLLKPGLMSSVLIEKGLPDDATVESVKFDKKNNLFEIAVSSKDFPKEFASPKVSPYVNIILRKMGQHENLY